MENTSISNATTETTTSDAMDPVTGEVKMSDLDIALAHLAHLIPPVVATDPRMYPFVGQKAVKERLSERPVQAAMMIVLYELQTAYEQASESTKDRNRRGFMSSHSVNGTRLARAIKSGAALTDEDWAKVATIAPHYSKQGAIALRTWAMKANPALAVTAQMFSIR